MIDSASWLDTLPDIQCGPSGECHFGDPVSEAARALGGTVAVPLTHLAWIAATGADTDTFLQGQLSNDLRKLTRGQAQFSSLSSAKGRMLAVLHLVRSGDGVLLELHRSVAEGVVKRLRMYVLRSKVTLAEAADCVGIGVAGPEAALAIGRLGLDVPTGLLECAWHGDIAVVHRRGTVPRYALLVPAERATDVWSRLAEELAPAGTQAWHLLDILAGVPVIYPVTQERFVPQMCNLDALGGISFDKGCYTGQEIVARVHYRGAVKRHMSTVITPDQSWVPGATIELPTGGKAEVVDAAPHPGGGLAALVVAGPEPS